MNYLIVVIFVFFITSSSRANVLNFDVMTNVRNGESYINLVLFEKETQLNIANATSADKIYIRLKSYDDTHNSKKNLTIRCTSQCGIEFVDDSKIPDINTLSLVNAHLLANTRMRVNSVVIDSSEEIITGLPIAKTAVITLKPSENMIAAQKLISGVNVIPGSGEFVYDTKIIYDENGAAINSHASQNNADALYNIISMRKVLKNLSWVSPVIAWFGVTKENRRVLDVSEIDIMPLVEDRNYVRSEVWKVADYTRSTAHLSSRDQNNKVNYGGTINDLSIVRYVDELRKNRLKVMFYPMIWLDMPDKPWRGLMRGKDTQEIHRFFTKEKGYNQFILHYANLLKGKVDAFVIGSELEDLLQSVDDKYESGDPRRYPAVAEMINLAKIVRKILGPKVVITYAANWSEYHHDKNGVHHLDPLWSSEYIDVVGIDAYLPIVKRGMGDITVEDIKEGWKSGELWDFYYDKDGKKKELAPEYGLKRIEYWWSNEHWSNGVKTSWRPKMKPIWFTEFGFPSMNKSVNVPYETYDPKSGKKPKHTSGNPDFALQIRAIQATLEYWRNKSEVVQNTFLWAWDVRPFPYFPQRLDLWSDGDQWSRGHWINGKIDLISQVKFLPNIDVCNLKTNANTIIIDGYYNRIKNIDTPSAIYTAKGAEIISKVLSLGCN